jgi:hypothetical protein
LVGFLGDSALLSRELEKHLDCLVKGAMVKGARLELIFAMVPHAIQELHDFARFAFPDLYQQRWGVV